MTHVPAALKLQVEQRAGGRCEYCRLSQVGQEARFHIDHVQPSKHGGQTTLENLCLACVSCSLRKAAKIRALDPHSAETVALFNPRTDRWAEHFSWEDCVVRGITAVGRATVATLCLNRSLILEIRQEEAWRGLFNWLSWRAGYTVFWLGGVANAANQLARSDFTVDPPTAGVSPYSSVLLHGATTGLEARW